MKIYERDYTILTDEELDEWERIKEKESITKDGKKLLFRKNLFREYPKAARHYISLFPNNYLDINELEESEKLIPFLDLFLELLDGAQTDERAILNFIKEKKAYFLVGAILRGYFNFGHHDAYIIPEFMLGVSYKVDYLLIGKNSGGYEFVFVEFEKPRGRITNGDGELGEVFRKGLNQVQDWDTWLDSNYSSLYEVFSKYKHPEIQRDGEFLKYDKTRIHFVVVAGRRDDFTEKTYRIKRSKFDREKISVLHYDNLFDVAKELIGKSTY
ncbi:Shedu anti-phage system protein SduA domain-containing protein [Anoxynatronum sibiricum]|uniref:Shedu anti-phage system protein SduA domain-containing protein n=1 Tax=Anoxynatronum sibiricum TaxID=210623 RepID=A0ABU9VWP0_9CLOT